MQAMTRFFRARLFALKTLALALLVGAGVSGCSPIGVDSPLPSFAALDGGGAESSARIQQVFIASTRQGERGAAAEKASSDGVHYSLATLTLPPGHKSGAIEKPMWGSPNTRDHIVVQSVRELDADEFHNELASHISGRIGVNRDVLVYVHGYNTSFDDARLTAAQIAADAKIGGVAVLFTWPSKAQLFGYVSDKDAAMASRDALQQLFSDLSETPGVGKIHVLAHSMGGWLAIEALRQEAIAGKRGLDGRLGEVMLAAPDIDMDVFASQMAKLRPAHVTVFATNKDKALSISSALAQSRQRVGAIDPKNPVDRQKIESLGAKVYDLSDYANGLIGHDAYGSTPEVLTSIGAAVAAPRAEDAGAMSILNASDYSAKPDE